MADEVVLPLTTVNGMQELGVATTVGQLIDGLMKYDREMPLVQRGGSGDFTMGCMVYEVSVMQHKEERTFFANALDKIWKKMDKARFEKPFKAIMIWK